MPTKSAKRATRATAPAKAATAKAAPETPTQTETGPPAAPPLGTPASGADHALSPGAVEARQMYDALKAAFQSKETAGDPGSLSLPDALWQSGPPLTIRHRNGSISFANPAFKDLQDALEDAKALTPSEDLAALVEGFGGPYTEELALEIEGESRFYMAWHELLAGDAMADYVVSHYLPADSLGRRLRALQTSDERWHDLTRLVSEIAWECGPDAVITYISPRVLHLLGYHPHDIIGRTWSFLAGEGNRLDERISDPSGRAPFRGLDLTLTDKDGQGRRFLIQGLPVFDRDTGTFIGFRGTADDMTDVIESQALLLETAKSADLASQAKSEFLANMSHELRTPLNAIIGFTEIMASEEFGPVGNPRYLEYLNSVLESSQHLLALINQVLDVAKIESGKLRLVEDAVEPESVIRTAVKVVTATFKRRDIAIASEVADPSVHLWADESKLRQILLNLLSNSIKFTLDGGRIQIVAKPDSDGSFLFVVRDSGIGIDPEKFETVLTPFEQIDSHLTRRFEGTGLGLPLAKALAEAHGGSLTLESVPGTGTTVTVRLPPDRVLRD